MRQTAPGTRTAPALLAMLVLACPLAAQTAEPQVQDVSKGWSVLVAPVADDRSGPEAEDGRWPLTSVTASWADQGLSGVSGTVWYRKHVYVAVPEAAAQANLALLLGPMTYGSWVLYADGVPIGAHGSQANPVPFPRARIVDLPRGTFDDGEIVLALRVQREAWVADMAGPGNSAFSGALMGPAGVLGMHLRGYELDQKQAQWGGLVFACLAFFFGLYHLYLFGSRPTQRAYLWFGLASLAFGCNALAVSPWTASAFVRFGSAFRLAAASGHAAAAFLLLFVWDTLDRKPGPVVAGYVFSHFALVALVAVAPFHLVAITEHVRFLWLVPGLALAVGVLFLEVRRGHPDAGALAVGAGAVAAAEVGELLRLSGAPLPEFLPFLGFSLALLTVAGTIANRFSRDHEELEDLRRELETRVDERTLALARATRDAEMANQAKSRFLANVSHELRTPLNAVIGFAGIIQKRAARTRGVLDKQQIEFLDRIRANGAHLLALVDRLLDLSAIEAGRVELSYSEVDLGGLVSSLLAELSPQATGKRLDLHAVVPARLAPVHTDAVRMKQILTNLVENAVRFTQRGTVTVTVHAVDGQARRIEVSDTGIGIPAARLAEITGAFAQADDSPTRRHGGLGLGLAITKSLCDLLGYALTLESTPASGTSAWVDLDPAAGVGRAGASSAPDEDALPDALPSRLPDGRGPGRGPLVPPPRRGTE